MNKTTGVTGNPIYPIILAIGFCHLFNDTLQAVVPAMFPVLEKELGLTFTQLGFITFTLQMIASVLQPVFGYYSDKQPKPFWLPLAMISSSVGILGLALAPSYTWIIVSMIFLGFGSAIFHPEGSKVSFMAAGSKRGLAQSIYQVGGNIGQSLAPLISAFVLVPFGQIGAAWFLIVSAVGIFVLSRIALWYRGVLEEEKRSNKKRTLISKFAALSKKQVYVALGLLLFLLFIRSFYVANITNFYVFHLMDHYDLHVKSAQIVVFVFLFFGALGTFFGGPLADRIGSKTVIMASMIIPMPFAIMLPYVPLWGAWILAFIIGFSIMLSFSVTVVYAQELMPDKIGMMSGLTVGLSFGMGALGSVVIGMLMDHIGIMATMQIVSFLPLLGIVGFWMPNDRKV